MLSNQQALSELCQACGLCCNGSLFTFLPVTEAEANRIRERLPFSLFPPQLG